jgi:hypothetical protein
MLGVLASVAVFTRGRGLLHRRVVTPEVVTEEPVGSLA